MDFCGGSLAVDRKPCEAMMTNDRIVGPCQNCEVISDRLRALLDAYKQDLATLEFIRSNDIPIKFLGRPLAEYAAHLIVTLRAENASLREALDEISGWGDPLDYLQTIARAALASAHPGDREPSNTTPERP